MKKSGLIQSLIVLSAILSPVVSSAKTLTIAVIDTGIDKDNPHLCKQGHYDFVKNKPILGDFHGHGTHIAGIIAKEAGDGDYCIISLKFYSDANPGKVNLKNTMAAFRRAIDLKVDIINYSGGGPWFNEEEFLLIKEALSKKIKLVFAAGNEHDNLDKVCNYYPACYSRDIVMVGNLRIYRDYRNLDEITRKLATLANMADKIGTVEYCKSETSNYGKRVSRWEVGDNVLSTLPSGRTGYMSGTSQATAVATGKIVKEMLSQAK